MISVKKIAQKFFRIAIRGKKNRTVAVIAGADIIEEINIIIRHRLSANVPLKNEFLFGLPNSIDGRIRVVNICKEMRTISKLCGAKKPDLLRGTGLRKHVATKCIELELNDNALGDVINHLGHSEKIHRDFYRQPIKSKTIVQVAKVLEAVQGDVDYDSDENVDDLSDFIEIPGSVPKNGLQKKSKGTHVYVSQPSCSNDNTELANEYDLHDLEPYLGTNTVIIENMNDDIPEGLSLSTDTDVNQKIIKKNCEMTEKMEKKRWTENEKHIVCSAFSHHLQAGTLPHLKDIDNLMEQHPCLQSRSRQSIKTWISNQFKTPSKPIFSKLKIIGNEAVRLNLTKVIKDNSDNTPPLA
ncbi:uncharacterized protein LOC106693954 [Microplitis demolitor]|uniref:uncharacterized protein LOC106693954 n=1 Tax=Microplitis demolitor TaxID=69319 RepID=UPI00235B6BB5|nr:uncharacterized protein LOC106693954 [Microplitis demolitor]